MKGLSAMIAVLFLLLAAKAVVEDGVLGERQGTRHGGVGLDTVGMPGVCLVVLLSVAGARASAADVFGDAAAVWHMADPAESTGRGRGLTVRGDARLGVELRGAARKASLVRGGDAYAAELAGGWLEVGAGAADGLHLKKDTDLTICMRVKPTSGHLDGSLLARWAGRGDECSLDLAVWYMPWAELGRWNLGFVVSAWKQPFGHGGHLRIQDSDQEGWHDIVIRVDRTRIHDSKWWGVFPTTDIFIDGVLRRRSYSAGKHCWWLKGQMFLHDVVSCLIGAEPGGRRPFRGLVDHVALWRRALADEEVAFLCGRILCGEPREEQVIPPTFPRYGGALFPDEMAPEQRCRRLDEEMPRALAELLERNRHFPRYHIALPGVVMNTHGLYFKGRHHVFPITETVGKQYPPADLHYYRHLSSADLVGWKLMPLPIRPGNFGFQPNGVFFVDDAGTPTVIAQNVMDKATSTDENLVRWEVTSKRPRIVKDGPAEVVATPRYWRDMSIFKDGDVWYMITQTPGQKPSFIYRSDDAEEWEYAGVFHPDAGGECIQVFRLGEKLVVLNAGPSTGGDYMVGRFENERFVLEGAGTQRHGSGRTLSYPERDEAGRFVALWSNFHSQHMMSSAKEDTIRGFAGTYALPQTLSIRPDNTLAFEPIPQTAELRGQHTGCSDTALMPGSIHMLEGLQGANLEVLAVIRSQRAETGIVLAQGDNRVEVYYAPDRKRVNLDLSRVFPLPAYQQTTVGAPLELEAGKPLRLRVFFDASIVEVYANGAVLMDWALFDRPDEVSVGLFARGGQAHVIRADVWRMNTIWQEWECE